MRDSYQTYFPSRVDGSEDTYNSYLQAPDDDLVFVAEQHGREDVVTKAFVAKPVTYGPKFTQKASKYINKRPEAGAGYLKHVAYQRLDPRTGKMVQVKGGRNAPIGKTALTPHHFDVAVQKKHGLTSDETAKAVLRYVAQKKVKTEGELHEAVQEFVQKNYDSESPEAEGRWVSKILEMLFHHKAVQVTHPGDDIAYGNMRVRDMAMVNQWVQGSNNTVGSVRLRVGVAKLFKQDIDRVTERARKNSSDKKRFDRMLAEAKADKDLTASVERVAALSQAAYKGQKTVVLYRAISAKQAAEIRKQLKLKSNMTARGQVIALPVDNVTSMTENPEDAHGAFAGFGGMTIRVEIPVSAIVMSYRAMPSTMSMSGTTEWEVVVATPGKLNATIVADRHLGGNSLPGAPAGYTGSSLQKRAEAERARFVSRHTQLPKKDKGVYFYAPKKAPADFLQLEDVFS